MPSSSVFTGTANPSVKGTSRKRAAPYVERVRRAWRVTSSV